MTFFDKAQKTVWESKIFLTSASGTAVYLYEIKNLKPSIETNLKCIINLNLKARTIKLLKEGLEKYLHDLGAGKEFLEGS